MQRPKRVFAAYDGSVCRGFRSPVSSAKVWTCEAEYVFARLAVCPRVTCRPKAVVIDSADGPSAGLENRRRAPAAVLSRAVIDAEAKEGRRLFFARGVCV